MNGPDAGHHLAEQRGKPRQLVPRVLVREERTNLRAVRHGDRLVVTSDRHVEERP